MPVSPNYRGEWSFAAWDHKIRGHAATFWASVRDGMDTNAGPLLNFYFYNVQRCVAVVVKRMQPTGILGGCN